MSDLLPLKPPAEVAYPVPLHHGEPTSRAAAQSMIEQAATDREACLRAYEHLGPMTADECAVALAWFDPYRARRRVSELLASGHLVRAGLSRPTASGRAASVLTIRS